MDTDATRHDDRLLLIEDVYSAAKQVVPSNRSGFIRERCQGDRDLFLDVSRMLSAVDGEGSVFDEAEAEWFAGLQGNRIETFVVGRPCREGGSTARAFFASRQSSGHQVQFIAKVLPTGLTQSRTTIRRFERECGMLSALKLRGLRVHSSGSDGRMAYIVMENAGNRSLSEECERLRSGNPESALVARSGARDYRAIALLVIDLAKRVKTLHDSGILHRDIAPANVLIVDGRRSTVDRLRARVIDLGNACRKSDASADRGFGTPGYSSPEQLGVSGYPVDERTDIYSVGGILFRLITDSFPSSDYRRPGVFNPDPHSVRQIQRLNPDVPTGLAQICAKALSWDPGRRHTGVHHLLFELENYLCTGSTRNSSRGHSLIRLIILAFLAGAITVSPML